MPYIMLHHPWDEQPSLVQQSTNKAVGIIYGQWKPSVQTCFCMQIPITYENLYLYDEHCELLSRRAYKFPS